MRKIKRIVGICILSACWMGVLAQTKMPAARQSSFVKITDKGELQYIPDEKGNVIPDFSRVGYHHGDKSIPQYTVTKSISPVRGDNWAHIQKAVDELAKLPVDANGHRGVLLLKRGIYPVSKSIVIKAGGIVLKGEGSNVNETRLIATSKERYSLIKVVGEGIREEVSGTRVHISQKFVPVGTHSFMVSSAADYEKGDKIIVYRPGTQKWIHDIQMDRIVERKGTRQWTPKEYNLAFEREVTKVEGDRIYIDNPIVMEMEEQYGGGEIYKYIFDGRISEVGITDLCLESEFEDYEDNNTVG